jgi:cytochrome c553
MLNKFHMWAVMGILMMGFGSARADLGTYDMKGDPKAGADKSAVCQGCHGATGNSEDATFPRLAGQYASYIAKQETDFKNGIRTNNDTMAGMAATVESVQDSLDIGAYFSSQKMVSKPLAPVDNKLADQGKNIFYNGIPEKNVYGCVNCHGERGKGKAPNISVFPVIGGQHRDYLIKELTDLRAGTRGNDPAGMMGNIAKGLSDEEIKALANYLSSLLP